MTFTPTAEQRAILDAFTAGSNLVIQAGAGTGKTTTLKMLANADPTRYGTYLAFNKSIAQAAAKSFPATVRSLTAHGLAWREYGAQFGKRMNAERRGFGPTIDFLGVEPLTFRGPDGSPRRLSAYQVTRLVLDTVKAFCASADADLTADHVPTVPGLDRPGLAGVLARGENHDRLIRYILPRAEEAWSDVQQEQGVLAYDHAYYLKGYALTGPRLGGQYLLFDEAQDAAPVIAGIINAQTHLQRVFVGDSAQAIYGFTGAIDAMADFATQPGVEVLTLSESFRFGPTIATAANDLLDVLDAPLRLTGTPTLRSTLGTLDGPDGPAADAVLCRTNAGALAEVINLQGQGRKVCLLGNADDLRRFVEAARDLQERGTTNHPALMAFETWAQVVEYVDTDPSGSDLTTMVDLIEDYGAGVLLATLERCRPESAAEVVVSTAHKAKGREWQRVRISPDFSLAEDLPPEIARAETMLAYVAVTRAQDMLDPGLLGTWIGFSRADADASPAAAAAPAETSATTRVEAPTKGTQARPVHPVNPLNRATPTAATPDPAAAAPVTLSIPAPVWAQVEHLARTLHTDPHDLAVRLLTGTLSALAPDPHEPAR